MGTAGSLNHLEKDKIAGCGLAIAMFALLPFNALCHLLHWQTRSPVTSISASCSRVGASPSPGEHAGE